MARRFNVSRGHRWFLLIFTLLFILPAGVGFSYKLYEFINVSGLKAEGRFEEGRFALIPLMNYLLMFAGMFCLLLWAIYNGMFKDVESPKYTMLESERRLDEADGVIWDDNSVRS
jgi:hypothetical protein